LIFGLAALVAIARLAISGDTGIAHLASEYATPSVILFGADVSWALGLTGREPSYRDLARNPGDPLGRWVHPAFLEIGSDEVLEAAEARLGIRTPADQSPTPDRRV
jgi:ADP-heptose:LPS heptosyltransferase